MNLPTKAGEYTVPEEVLKAYRELYPNADREFARMRIWLESNVARRPAKPDTAPKFIANWFKKSRPMPAVVRPMQTAADRRYAFIASLTGESRQDERTIDVDAYERSAPRLSIGGR